MSAGNSSASNAELQAANEALHSSRVAAMNLMEDAIAARQKAEQTEQALRASRVAALNLMEDALAARRKAEEAEEALRQSEERFRLAIKATNDAIWDINLTTGTVHWNETYATAFGRPPETEDSWQWWIEHIHPEDRDRTAGALRAAIDGQETTWTCEYRFLRADGDWADIYDRAYIARDASGKALRVVGAMLDLTERKRAEERIARLNQDLQRRVAELQAIFDTAPIGLAIAEDAEGHHIRGNPANERMFGIDTGGELSKAGPRPAGFRCLHNGRELAVMELPMQRAVRGETVSGQMMDAVREDGQSFSLYGSAAPLFDEMGKPRGAVGAFLDITSLKRAEEELRQAKAAAEAANEAKGQFLANMSHELRTPMNAILGMIDVALPKATDPTVQDCLQTAKGSADLLLTLLNDLLDSAKIESGKLELESAPFSLRRMLDQITRVLAVRASEKGLCFYCRMPDQTPDAVTGDRMRLQQVLLNLAGNAIKFTERGDVEIGLHALSQDGKACLEFAVRDTGIGIPPSGLERLFQPFSQADPSMTRRFGGTGLGLSISKSLVEMMGGRIWAESEMGKGSTFYFTVRLPLAKELPPDFEARVAVPTVACAQLRVLLVEDNPANQKLATYILQDRGHLVEIAGDGQAAVYLTEQNRYDVILMDVQMPGMNGLEATAAIRKREDGGSRVPIIAMTAHAMRGDRDRCLAAGMDGYLSKPVNAQEMIGLVESLASGVVSVTQFAPVTSNPAATSSQATAIVFNLEEALTRCFNSTDMVREMIQCFFDEVDKLFPQMRLALESGDLVEVGRLGHRMKGTVVYLGAQPAKEAALRVERFCKSSGYTPREAEEAINALEHECIALKAALIGHPLSANATRDDSH